MGPKKMVQPTGWTKQQWRTTANVGRSNRTSNQSSTGTITRTVPRWTICSQRRAQLEMDLYNKCRPTAAHFPVQKRRRLPCPTAKQRHSHLRHHCLCPPPARPFVAKAVQKFSGTGTRRNLDKRPCLAVLGLLGALSGGKRKRRHRTIFTEEQLNMLEEAFRGTQYPDVSVREGMADKCNLCEERVEVWFKNRRAKLRKRNREVQQPTSTNPNSAPAGSHCVIKPKNNSLR
uniref:Homeobox domain-containing protein n=1 Tax=Globodera rostochiensis TaxID=31243 RepID=A0A914I4Y3_GLORO